MTVEPGDSGQAVVTLTIMPGGSKAFQVINVRQGRIVHIQGVRNRREALALAGITGDAA
jgi:hypothetical protein